MKYVILGILLLIIVSLMTAMYTMLKDRGRTTRTVKALTVRVSLSLLLLLIAVFIYKPSLLQTNRLIIYDQPATKKAPE